MLSARGSSDRRMSLTAVGTPVLRTPQRPLGHDQAGMPVRDKPRERPRAEIALALAGKAGTAFGAIGLASLTPFIRSEFELSSVLIGGIVAIVFLGAMIAIIPAGRITDRYRSGRVLGVCMLFLAVGLAVAAVAPSRALFFLGVGIAGLGYGAADPGSNVLVSANVSRRRRGILMGISHTGLTLGGLLGGLVLPSLAETTSWRVAVVLPIAVALLISIASLWVGGPEPRHLHRRAEPLRPSSLLGLGAYGFVMAGTQMTVLAFLAIYLVDRAAMSSTKAGIGVSVLLAGATLGRIAWGWFSDRLFHSRLLALRLAALTTAVSLVIVALVEGHVSIWPILFVLGFCSIGWNGVWIATAAESVPPTSVGRATSVVLIFAFAGAVLLPPAYGELVDRASSWPTTWIVAAAVVAGLLVLVRLSGSATRATT